jgi:hypothetical protein
MRMKNDEKAMIGYTSPHDLISTILGIISWVVNTWLAFMFAFTTFITNYVWDSSEAIFTLLFLMLSDWATGVFLALRATYQLKYKRTALTEEDINKLRKRSFRSTRFPRIFVSILLSLGLLSIGWWLSKANAIYYFLPGMIYGGLTGTYLISLIENAAEYGLLPMNVVTLIKEKLNPLNWVK